MSTHTGSPKRGEVWLVNFDPTIGSEIQKTRPAVILQNNVGNRYSPVTIVAAISGRPYVERHPTKVMIHPPEVGLHEVSTVLLNQVRTVDKKRLLGKIGSLKHETMLQVDDALKISLGLINI